jgi:hypothetical protein
MEMVIECSWMLGVDGLNERIGREAQRKANGKERIEVGCKPGS